MWNKIVAFLIILLITTPLFAHPGRVDGNGGHRVNKKYTYDSRYIEIIDGAKRYKDGKVVFNKGDYHYHINPEFVPGVSNGIFLPVKKKDLKKVRTDIVYQSEENVVASKNSDIYHRSTCGLINNMKIENVVLFEDKEDARKSDYRPCKRCKPDEVQR